MFKYSGSILNYHIIFIVKNKIATAENVKQNIEQKSIKQYKISKIFRLSYFAQFWIKLESEQNYLRNINEHLY